MERDDTTPPVLRLKVREALPKDVGKAYARIGPEDLKRLGLEIGDTVEIQGKRSAVCKAMPAFAEYRGQSAVQLDGLTRENAGLGIDDAATIKKIRCRPADRVTLAPTTVVPTGRDLAYIGSLLDGLPIMEGAKIQASLFGSRSASFKVESISPKGPAIIHPGTALEIGRRQEEESTRSLSYEDIGGLKPHIQRIREMIELPLRYPELFRRLGIDAPKGVLLYGPPGCGKTLIARAIAHETEAKFYTISGPEIVHKFYGESEAHLRKVFEEAARNQPAIIFLDEIDAIAPSRVNVTGEVEKRIVAQLLALMDGLARRENVIVIAATNIPNSLDPALRRPGRFDREIVIPIPDRNGRREILEIHSRGMPLAADVRMDHLAEITHGFVGADLEALCREAAMICLRQIMGDIDFSRSELPYEIIASLEVRMEHFLIALREIEPSAIREVFVESPNVRWEDVGGLSPLKARLLEAVEWPLTYPDLFEKGGVRAPKGILLVGPPGCGKTLIAKAIATESNTNFISVKGPALMSKWVGESEKGIREIFHKARQAAPCVIFFDEIDALVPARGASSSDSHVAERLLSQFLAEFDGLEELRGVLVLGATNRRDMLDPAVLRPGRFDEIVELGMPDRVGREEILSIHLRNKPVESGMSVAAMADATEGFSGAELAAVARRAAMKAVRRAVTAAKAEAARLAASAGEATPPDTPAFSPAISLTAADLFEAVEDLRKER